MGIAVPGLFNLDAMVLGLLALFWQPGWIVALFAVDFVLEAVYGIHATFWVGYVETGLSVRYLFSIMSPRYILLAGLTALATVALLAWVWTHWRPRPAPQRRWMLVVVVLAVLAPVVVWTRAQRHHRRAAQAALHRGEGSWDSLAPTWANVAVSPLLSPALGLVHAWGHENIGGWLRGRYSSTEAAASASDNVLPLLLGAPSRPARMNFVLVLVESRGLANSPLLRAALEAPFHSPALSARYRLQTGTVAFSGTTSAGELRELCQYRLVLSKAPLALDPADFAKCIPWRFADTGYATLAVDTAVQFWPGGAPPASPSRLDKCPLCCSLPSPPSRTLAQITRNSYNLAS